MANYEEKLEKIKKQTELSPFNRTGYGVSVDVASLYRSLGFYHERDEEKTITNDSSPNDEELIKRMTPEFQRDADKWSLERKITFVENVISGFRTEITLYSINESDSNSSCLDDCFILDGLQRLTAII